jgi:hypothetical protein
MSKLWQSVKKKVGDARYSAARREPLRIAAARYYYKSKEAVFDFFGRKCKKCGFSDIRALHLDHVLGDGYKDRKEHSFGFGYVRGLIETNPSEARRRFQVLCANCNQIKVYENNEHKGKQRYRRLLEEFHRDRMKSLLPKNMR